MCTGHGDLLGLRHGHWYKGQVMELLIHPGKHLRQELCLGVCVKGSQLSAVWASLGSRHFKSLFKLRAGLFYKRGVSS